MLRKPDRHSDLNDIIKEIIGGGLAIKYNFHAISNIGTRTTNSDSFLCWPLRCADVDKPRTVEIRGVFEEQPLACFAICDGVGDCDGAIASSAVIDAIADAFREINNSLPLEVIAFQLADNGKRAIQQKGAKYTTTLIIAILLGSQFLILNIGDSCCFKLHVSEKQELSFPHTLGNAKDILGVCPNQHDSETLVEHLGSEASVWEQAHLSKGTLSHNEKLLICTDGFLATCKTKNVSYFYSEFSANCFNDSSDNSTAIWISASDK